MCWKEPTIRCRYIMCSQEWMQPYSGIHRISNLKIIKVSGENCDEYGQQWYTDRKNSRNKRKRLYHWARVEQIDEMSNVTYRDYKDASGNVVKSESVCASKYKPLNSGSWCKKDVTCKKQAGQRREICPACFFSYRWERWKKSTRKSSFYSIAFCSRKWKKFFTYFFIFFCSFSVHFFISPTGKKKNRRDRFLFSVPPVFYR